MVARHTKACFYKTSGLQYVNKAEETNFGSSLYQNLLGQVSMVGWAVHLMDISPSHAHHKHRRYPSESSSSNTSPHRYTTEDPQPHLSSVSLYGYNII